MADEKRDDEAIFRVDTVPPPPGDGDAYNAPTKVGPVSADAWAELIRQADVEGKKNADLDERIAESGPMSTPRGSADAAPVSNTVPTSAAPPANGEVPRLYNEDVDESGAATLLHHSAKRVNDASARADASVFGEAPPSSAPSHDSEAPASVLGPTKTSRVRRYAILGTFAIAVGLVIWLLTH